MEKLCTAGQATNENTKRRMRLACWMPKATNTHLKYAILIAFSLQNCLQECASIIRPYFACLLISNFGLFLVVEKLSPTQREGHRLTVQMNRVLARKFGGRK